MFSSPAVRKSVTTKQNIPSCRKKGKPCCWSSKWSRKRTTHRAEFLFPCIHMRGNEPESKARSLLRTRFPFPLKSPFLPCTNPPEPPAFPISTPAPLSMCGEHTQTPLCSWFTPHCNNNITQHQPLSSLWELSAALPLRTTALDTAE